MTTPIKLKRQQVKVGAITYAQLILHMLDGNHTCEELAALSGLHYVTVLQYTRELHKAGAAHTAVGRKTVVVEMSSRSTRSATARMPSDSA